MANHPFNGHSCISISRTYTACKKTILQQRALMQAVKSSLEDTDVELLITDIKDDLNEVDEIISNLSLKVPAIVIINKPIKQTKK